MQVESNDSFMTHATDAPTSASNGIPTTQAEIPVVFAPSIGAGSLTEDQVNGVELVANEFQEKLGSPPQWAEDPAYAARWEVARAAADERLREVLGLDAYNAHAEALLKGMTNNFR